MLDKTEPGALARHRAGDDVLSLERLPSNLPRHSAQAPLSPPIRWRIDKWLAVVDFEVMQ